MTENVNGGTNAGGGGAPQPGAGAGTGTYDFLTSLPTDLRSDGVLKNFGGPDGHVKLAKSYGELVRAHSSRSMADMDAPADDKGRRAVLSKLGAAPPEKPDDYRLPDTAPAKQFRAWAHKHGLTVRQAEALYADMDGATAQSANERKTRMEQRARDSAAALKTEWGAEYDANAQLVTRGMEHYLPDKDVRQLLMDTGIGHHPTVAKLFQQLGRSLKEGTMLPGSGSGGGMGGTLETAQAELYKFEKENKALLLSQDERSPAVKAAKDRRLELLGNFAKIKHASRTA